MDAEWTYTYTEQGYVKRFDYEHERVIEAYDYHERYESFEYYVYSFDERGNWIERTLFRNDGISALYVRKYEYY